ncbi:MAG: hypothetical protein IJE49_11285 [Agathobacter sp.]|nr:hypothetical protein [Agathobacter sp.]
MAESIDKKQLEEITEEMTNALNATSKLQEEVSDLNTTVKKIDISKLSDMTDALVQSRDAAKEASNNSSGLVTAMEKLSQKMPNIKTAVDKITQSVPNIKTVIDGISKKLPDVKKTMENIYKATESTEEYFKSFNYYTDTFGEIASKWDKDFETYGSENAKKYSNTFVQQMNESLGKLSGMKVSLSVDMESGILTESGMKDLGLNVQEVTQFVAEFASISNSMGQTGDVSLAIADVFTKLAGDLSSYFNVDYSTIMEDLQNALLGQTDALEEYRINLSDVQLQTLAYEYGIEKSVEDMTQAEKAQLKMIAILKQSDAYWGNLADTINTPANTFRELANNCKEVVTVFGQLFMPVLEQILPFVDGVVIAIGNLLTSIAGFFGIKVNMDDMGIGTDGASAELEANHGGETAYTIEYNSSFSLADGFLEEVSLYEEVWNQAYENMNKKSQEWADKVDTFFGPVKSIFSSLAIGDYVSVGENVGLLAISIMDFFKNAIDSVDWQAVGEKIGEFLEGINWTEVFSSIGELVGEAIGSAFEVLGSIFDAAPLETGIVTAIGLIKWTGLGKAISSGSLFKSLATLFSGQLLEGNGFFSKLGNAFALTIGDAGDFGDALITEFEGLGGIVKIVTAVGSKIRQVVSEIGTGMRDFLSVIRLVLRAVAEKVGALIPKIVGEMTSALSKAGVFIKSIITFLQPFAAAIASVVVIIAGIAFAVSNFVTMFQEGFSWVNEAIMLVGIALAAVGAIFLGAPALVSGIVAGIVAVVATLVVIIKENWNEICAFISSAIGLIGEMFVLWGVGIVNNFKAVVSIIGSVLKELWNSIKAIFESLKTIFCGFIEFITGVFSLDWKKAWNGLVNIFSGIFGTIKNVLIMPLNAVIALIETLVNKIIGGWNSLVKALNKFSIDIPSWVPEIGGKKFGINIKTASTITIPRFASGGFPEDGWFRASHGEIMGRFDNGQSVVANNMQITEGIARGVREAVSGVLIPYLADIADSSRRTANKDFTVASRDVFEAVRAESSNYTRRTGELAFI